MRFLFNWSAGFAVTRSGLQLSASEDGTLDRKSFNGCAAEAFTRLRSLVNILGGGSAGQGRTPSYSEPKVIWLYFSLKSIQTLSRRTIHHRWRLNVPHLLFFSLFLNNFLGLWNKSNIKMSRYCETVPFLPSVCHSSRRTHFRGRPRGRLSPTGSTFWKRAEIMSSCDCRHWAALSFTDNYLGNNLTRITSWCFTG